MGVNIVLSIVSKLPLQDKDSLLTFNNFGPSNSCLPPNMEVLTFLFINVACYVGCSPLTFNLVQFSLFVHMTSISRNLIPTKKYP